MKNKKRGFNDVCHIHQHLLTLIAFLFFYAGYSQTNNSPFCYLRNKNFSGQDLTNANFSGADLDSANFSNAIISGANFSNASLQGARFANATASVTAQGPVNFSLCNLTSTDFSSSNLDSAIFYHANISCANFSNANLTSAQMGGDLKFLDGCPADFKGAKLSCGFIPFVHITNVKDAVLPPCLQTALANPPEGGSHVVISQSLTLPGDTLYVANTGTDNNSCGAATSPCRTVDQAVTNCKGKASTVAVEYGVYQLTTSLKLNNIKLVGGYHNGQPTTFQSTLHAPPGGLPAITADGGKVGISRFIINGSSSTQGAPSITITAINNSEVTMDNTNINSFKGGNGGSGLDANQGNEGDSGRMGPYNNTAGGLGGISICDGNNNGGNGGSGVTVISVTCHLQGYCEVNEVDFTVNGSSKNDGQPGGTDYSAPGSSYTTYTRQWCWDSQVPKGPPTGSNGKPGGCGDKGYANVTTSGTFSNDQWKSNFGGDGFKGHNGGGGGGGGGSFGCVRCCNCLYNGTYSNGKGGGGGGAGGCGATGGSGGSMGGASFSIVLIDSKFVCDATVKLTNGAGGDGGRGGNGNIGGSGGAGGGPPQRDNDCESYGSGGGNGGAGGASGGGAGGNGGPSIGIALVGSSSVTGIPIFYGGRSGKPGDGGIGGSPSANATCNGKNGDQGLNGTVADTFKFQNY